MTSEPPSFESSVGFALGFLAAADEQLRAEWGRGDVLSIRQHRSLRRAREAIATARRELGVVAGDEL